jgi:taurine dioxygenase
MSLRILPEDGSLGAEVSGVDLSGALDGEAVKGIYQAFLDHLVIVIRGQSMPPERQVELSRQFGEVDIHILSQFQLADFPEILILSNKKDANGKPVGLEDAGRYWHTDVSYTEIPSKASLLYAVEVPKDAGDTLFADMYAAYEDLSEAMKAKVDGRQAVHGLDRTTAPKWSDEQLAATPQVSHPLVRTHPETARKALFFAAFIQEISGYDKHESDQLIAALAEHCVQDKFIYRHRWRAGDLVMWDNRCLIHRATDFDGSLTRHLHRTTLVGDRPV